MPRNPRGVRAIMTINRITLVNALACYLAVASTAIAADSFPVSIRVDARKPKGELKPIWRFFGADEPNYAYMQHGQKLIGELGKLRTKQNYFPTHYLLTCGEGRAVRTMV